MDRGARWATVAKCRTQLNAHAQQDSRVYFPIKDPLPPLSMLFSNTEHDSDLLRSAAFPTPRHFPIKMKSVSSFSIRTKAIENDLASDLYMQG